MAERILVLGGCRSGKSRQALDLAARHRGGRRVFLATCDPADTEMRQRVARHRRERDADWETIEVPVALPEAIARYAPGAAVILVDCLTLWVSNLLLGGHPAPVAEHLQRLAAALTGAACPLILVANEVGLGIVPDNRLARLFRDTAGEVNAAVARVCDTVLLVVAGIPMTVKGSGGGDRPPSAPPC